MSTQIVVLGGGYAGILAALRLHHRTRNADITLINNADVFVNRIRLHEVAAGSKPATTPIRHLLRGTRVHFQQGNVTGIDTTNRLIKMETPTGTTQVHYDRLIYALGSSPDRSHVPGAQEYTYTIDPQSTTQLAAMLPKTGHLMIVGGGLTAIEAATEIAEKYPNLRVEVLTAETLGAGLSTSAARYLHEVFAQLRITVREQVRVSRVEKNCVVDGNGNAYPFEACLWLAGFKVSGLARAAGLAANERGQVLVDEHLQSISHPEIYGAGDASAIRAFPLRMACATAMPMAAFAADSISAELNNKPRQAFRFAFAARCISLGRRRGLVQVVRWDDTPRELILTGRIGALVKESIMRYVMQSLRLERLGAFYFWPKSKPTQARSVAAHVSST